VKLHRRPGFSAYLEQLRKSYGDLSSPKRHFVLEAANRQPFETVMRELSRWCEVEDDTDINCDVCFTLIMRCAPPLIVKLSMVGPYALVLSFGEDGLAAQGKTLSPERSSDPPGIADRVFEVLAEEGFIVVPEEQMEAMVPVAFSDNDTETSLYAALFEPEGDVPWLRRD
jgi:hypothetical protein